MAVVTSRPALKTASCNAETSPCCSGCTTNVVSSRKIQSETVKGTVAVAITLDIPLDHRV
jgi:hypothetical protein